MSTLINFERLESDLEGLQRSFREAEPFELLVLDEFLHTEEFKRLDPELLCSVVSTTEQSSDFLFAKNKSENPHFEKLSDPLSGLRDELLSPRFRSWLSKVVDMDVFIDPDFVGGGLHQGGTGSFLEMHADFSRHPVRYKWVRELNLLLYLNVDWKPEYGGELELQNKNNLKTHKIEPLANRMVIMLTKGHTLHGYQAIKFPQGRLRASIASYAYTLDNGDNFTPYRSTTWHPSGGTTKRLASFFNVITPIKQRLLGSRTAKRAKK